MDTVLPLYKARAMTCGELIINFKNTFNAYAKETISVAGRLDPMAEGLVLLLIGEANKKRHFFESLDKHYRTQMLLGVETDTYDVLGLITKISIPPSLTQIKQELHKLIPNLKGTYQQPFPPFSSKTVQGKPLYYWTRKGVLFPTYPTKEVTVTDFQINKFSLVNQKEILNEILSDISRVKGDFRQDTILKRWQRIKSDLPSTLPLVTAEIICSSGTYIRSLVNSIGKQIGCGAIAYSIERIRIGSYTLDDAIILKN